MRSLVEALCSDRCAGRRPGTAGGLEARRLIVEALRAAGLDPAEQEVPGCRGANVLATIPGDLDRWVLVAAHYDHLGVDPLARGGGAIYRGADDNAAAVAILVEVATRLAEKRPRGRGVIVAAFDAEEPPYYMTESMGSEFYARHPSVDLARIDMMVCMDLVGHALGPEGLPQDVRDTVFALGAERSVGTSEIVRSIEAPGVVVRAVDAEIVAPQSDYAAFWERERPFLFLTNGRSRVYHTPDDVPALLAWDKMAATARWLERFVRASCERDDGVPVFVDRRDDVATLDAFLELTERLLPFSREAEVGHQLARALRGQCRADGTLPEARHPELMMLIHALEGGLA